ncbi:MAG: NAD(P)-dependent glycerol-3-phosphate dehydrogenase [Verrucomicrobiales bacterium]|jgi:glycerol-3-phosphate dehydrogenase (NAD(P)+)|nr:NAD(P)-dependent glycerol-3-phosphate dehydrogenase [Verrucomicrobiales bacterium]
MKPQAAVLGAGSWGTGLSIALSDSGRDVILYGNEQSVRDDINQNHRNSKYLPDILLPDSIRCSTDIADLCEMPVILLVVPSQVARIVLSQLATVGLPTDSIIVSCTKGIDPTSGKLMHDLIEEFFPENPVAVLSGPSHAEEVAKRMATLATIGSSNEGVAARVQEIFALPWFRTYTSNDVIGIELGGVVKNVFAIAAGAIDGLGLGDNAKAAMVTRGLAEMTRLGIALGAREETIRGLSGLGDLIVTCYSVHSRNNRVGRMLGAGMSLDEAIAQMNQVAEGVPNAKNAFALARKLGVRTPLIDEVYAVLFENKPPADALRELLVRDQRSEAD